jgi:hypothetical protein
LRDEPVEQLGMELQHRAAEPARHRAGRRRRARRHHGDLRCDARSRRAGRRGRRRRGVALELDRARAGSIGDADAPGVDAFELHAGRDLRARGHDARAVARSEHRHTLAIALGEHADEAQVGGRGGRRRSGSVAAAGPQAGRDDRRRRVGRRGHARPGSGGLAQRQIQCAATHANSTNAAAVAARISMRSRNGRRSTASFIGVAGGRARYTRASLAFGFLA